MKIYKSLTDRLEIVGHAVFTFKGQTAEIDPEVAEYHIANGVPMVEVSEPVAPVEVLNDERI